MNKYFKGLILSTPLLLLSVGLPFLILGITYWTNSSLFPYPLLMAIFLCLYGLLSYLTGDIYLFRYKKKENIIVGQVPEEIKTKVSNIRRPFIYATIGTAIAFGVLVIIFLATGNHWPIIG